MPATTFGDKCYLTVCLNPTIQQTIVFPKLVKGEVNRSAEYRVDIAGKGICPARVLGQLGRRAIHLTHLGGPTREWFLAMCTEDRIDVRWVESGSAIRFCTTVIDSEDHTATELVQEAQSVALGAPQNIIKAFLAVLPEVSTVMLSGTTAKGYPSDMMPTLARFAAEAHKHLYLDLKGSALLESLVYHPTVVKPNLEELFQTYDSGHRAPGVNADESAIHALVSRVGKEYWERYGTYLVVTRGIAPTLFWDGKVLREAPVTPVEVKNPIGSGDSFNAGITSALEDGATIAEAVAEGNRLGSINASLLKPGSILA